MARRPKRPASTPKPLPHQSQSPAPKPAKPARARPPKKPSPAQPLFLTVEEAAARLRVSTKTIRRWIDSGELPAVRVGSHIRIPLGALLHFAGSLPPARPLGTQHAQVP